jgi:hypothetical protein
MFKSKTQTQKVLSFVTALWLASAALTQAEELAEAPVAPSPWWSKAKDSTQPLPTSNSMSSPSAHDSTELHSTQPVPPESSDIKPMSSESHVMKFVSSTPPKEREDHWAIHFKFGLNKPDLSDWSQYYGSSSMNSYQLGAQYFIKHGWSLRTTISQMTAEGYGTLPSTGLRGADIEYTFQPVQLGVVYEFFNSSKRAVKPFLSLGYTYATYEQKISSQPDIKGHVDGTYFGGGLTFNLFPFDKGTASKKGGNYENIYWILEVEKSILKSNVDLGGLSYQLGLQLRF